jgi:hypothetical protein
MGMGGEKILILIKTNIRDWFKKQMEKEQRRMDRLMGIQKNMISDMTEYRIGSWNPWSTINLQLITNNRQFPNLTIDRYGRIPITTPLKTVLDICENSNMCVGVYSNQYDQTGNEGFYLIDKYNTDLCVAHDELGKKHNNTHNRGKSVYLKTLESVGKVCH